MFAASVELKYLIRAKIHPMEEAQGFQSWWAAV